MDFSGFSTDNLSKIIKITRSWKQIILLKTQCLQNETPKEYISLGKEKNMKERNRKNTGVEFLRLPKEH